MDTAPHQIIVRIAHQELIALPLQEIKRIATLMSISSHNKRKEAIIEDIGKALGQLVLRSLSSFGNPHNMMSYEYLLNDPQIRKILEKYQEFLQNPKPFFSIPPQLLQYTAPQDLLQLSGLFENPFAALTQNLARMNPNFMQMPTKTVDLKACICSVAVTDEQENLILVCINKDCQRKVHIACVKVKADTEDAKIYECFDCVLKRCDPLHEVLSTLKSPSVLNNSKLDFMLDTEYIRMANTNEAIGVEIRCIRLEEKNIEQTWPHQGELYVNSRRELEFKPLQQNSSLKKRKDEKLFTRNVVPGLNSLFIKFAPKNDGQKGKNPETETYVAGIYVVKKLQPNELIDKLKQNCKRGTEECKNKIVKQFGNSAIQIDKLSYGLSCVLDMQPLKTPAKGAHCKHVNCFSLENYVSVWYKNNQRKWLCPICKLKAYDIVIDTYFQEILKNAEEADVFSSEFPEVTFNNMAEYTFTGKDKEMQKKQKEQKVKTESLSLEAVKSLPEATKTQSKKASEPVTILLDDSDDEAATDKKPLIPKTNPVLQKAVSAPQKINTVPQKVIAPQQIIAPKPQNTNTAQNAPTQVQSKGVVKAKPQNEAPKKQTEIQNNTQNAHKNTTRNSTQQAINPVQTKQINSMVEPIAASKTRTEERKANKSFGEQNGISHNVSITKIDSGFKMDIENASAKSSEIAISIVKAGKCPEVLDNQLVIKVAKKPDIAMDIELAPFLNERNEIVSKMLEEPDSLVQVVSNTMINLSNLTKAMDEESALPTYDQFLSQGSSLQVCDVKDHKVNSKKKMIRLFSRYLQKKTDKSPQEDGLLRKTISKNGNKARIPDLTKASLDSNEVVKGPVSNSLESSQARTAVNNKAPVPKEEKKQFNNKGKSDDPICLD